MKLKLTNIICISSLVISRVANMGSFAANSGSSATTSAVGSDDDQIKEKGKLFWRPVLLRSFFCFIGVVILLAVGHKGDPSML